MITSINEPTEQRLTAHCDDRGVFCKIEDDGMFINKDLKISDGFSTKIKRAYYVINPEVGTVRGFHYHKEEWKVFTIVNGSAKFVAINPNLPIDTDKDLPESVQNKIIAGTAKIFVASARVPKLIIIPPLWANGWVSLEPNTILISLSSSTTEESINDDVRFDPYKWGNFWRVKGR